MKKRKKSTKEGGTVKLDIKEFTLINGERVSISTTENYLHNPLVKVGEGLVVALVYSKRPRIDVFQEEPDSGIFVKVQDITWERDGHDKNFWEINVRHF